MRRWVKWMLLIVLSLVVGIGLAARRTNQRDESPAKTADDTVVNQVIVNADTSTKNTESSNTAAVNAANAANVPAEAAAPPKASVPTLAAITYQPANAVETAAVSRVKSFYQAYNSGSESDLINQFDLSVSVTSAAHAAVADGQARPYQVTIKQIDDRSDGSAVVYVTELRSNGHSYEREVELFPDKDGDLIVAYRAANNSAVLSGFDN